MFVKVERNRKGDNVRVMIVVLLRLALKVKALVRVGGGRRKQGTTQTSMNATVPPH